MRNYYDKEQNVNKVPSKHEIVAVKTSENDIITHFKLEDGRIVSKDQAISIAESEGIKGVNIGRTRGEDHTKILRANPTDDPSKALMNLPRFQ